MGRRAMERGDRLGVAQPTERSQDEVPVVDGLAASRGHEGEALGDCIAGVGRDLEGVHAQPTEAERDRERVPLAEEHRRGGDRRETLQQGAPVRGEEVPAEAEEDVPQLVNAEVDPLEEGRVARVAGEGRPREREIHEDRDSQGGAQRRGERGGAHARQNRQRWAKP